MQHIGWEDKCSHVIGQEMQEEKNYTLSSQPYVLSLDICTV